MAKRRAGVNKSQIIRDALGANPGKSSAEIAAILKEQGLKVTPQYVSTIKSNAKRKQWRKGKLGRRKLVRAATDGGITVEGGFASSGRLLPRAISFIRASGGIAQAKAALESVEEIGRLVR